MTWDGTKQFVKLVRQGVYVKADTFNADAEFTTLNMLSLALIPKSATLTIQTVTGSTATISFKLQGSVDGIIFVDLIALTAKDTHAHWPVADYTDTTDPLQPNYRIFKLLCVTVGSGNTLTAHLLLRR